MQNPETIIFDVNETLLDLGGLRSMLIDALGSSERLAEWFFRLLHGSLVANETDRFRSFETIAVEALAAIGLRADIDVSADTSELMVAAFRSLPVHPDVPDALDRLRSAGCRIVALSNGSSEGIPQQLESAGILDRFDHVFSVDEVQRFKPHRAVYEAALSRLGIVGSQALMVAAHDWDIVGARNVGIGGAFVTRPGVVWTLPDRQPDIVVASIAGVADALGA